MSLFKYFYVLLFSAFTFALNAQHITVLDLDHSTPVTEISYTYGIQKGTSDENGTIHFKKNDKDTMVLHHIDYGTWIWLPNDLTILINKGIYYRKSNTLNLYPVTVIAVRQTNLQHENLLNIDYQQRMEHDGAAILNQTPAFNSIRKSGNYGFDPVFRGYKYDQLNIVVNGAQGANAACPNRMDPPTSQMAPNMMDRIEILKGPHALRYGTGLGATINFIPTKLRFTEKTDVYGRVSAGYESNGNISRSEGQIGFSGKKVDISLLGSWSRGDDYQTGRKDTIQSDFSRASFGANLGFKLSANQQLRLTATYNLARNADFASLAMDLRNDDTWLFNLLHTAQFKKPHLKTWNTSLYGSFVDHLMDNELKTSTPKMVDASTLAKTYNYGGRTEGMFKLGKSKLYIGMDARSEGATGTRTREFIMGPNKGKVFYDNAWQNGNITKSALFTEYNLFTSSFNYVLSGRIEYNNSSIKDASKEFTDVYDKTKSQQVNPSISIGIIKPIKKVKLALWLGRAQRSASLTERFINYFPVGIDPYEMIGNPQLSPEANNQIDLGFEWKTKKTKVNIDLFGSYIQNHISSFIDTTLSPRLPNSPGVRRFTNIKSGLKTGFEASWIQQLPLGLQHQLSLAYTYAENLTNHTPLPEIPPMDMRYKLLGKYLKGKLQPEVTFRYVLEQPRVSSEYGETKTPAFALLDFKIGYSITKNIQINAGVNNLLNTAYYEHLNRSVKGSKAPIFAPGRSFFGHLSVQF